MKRQLEKIESIVKDLLSAMNFSGQVVIDESDHKFLRINIRSQDAAYLIGRGGESLRAIQRLCRAIFNRQFEELPQFIIDINDYQKNRFDLLKDMAEGFAWEVIRQKEPRWLAPMNAYERRIVHTILAKFKGVKTESEGEGEQRRVVIRPS